MNILMISGSLRSKSFNSALLREAASVAPAGVETRMADYRHIPHYDGDLASQGTPGSVTALVDEVRSADGVLIAVPEYNYSVPGVLKNAIDWVSRAENQPFKGKPVGLIGASMGTLGTARAQYHLRQVFVFLDSLVMNRPEVFVGGAHRKFDDDGKLADNETREFLGQFMEAFSAWVARNSEK